MKPVPQSRPAAASGIKAHDILYVLFKHKWKIIIPSLLGFILAGVMAYRYSRNPSYETFTNLLVKYVVESSIDPDAPTTNRGAKSLAVMDTEMEILKSFDVALDAVAELGPENVMPTGDEKPTQVEAANYISSHLTVTTARGSDVIKLSYRDTDPQRAVRVLTQIKESYLAKHLKIHRSTTAFQEVSAQTDQARSSLRTTEDEINQLKAKSGVISIEGTNADFEARRQFIRTNLMAAQVALSEQQAKVKAMEESAAAAAPPKVEGDAAAAPPPPTDTPAELASRRATALALAEFNDLSSRLEMLRQERNRTLLRRSASDPMVVSLDRQIAEVQAKKLDLGTKNPEFAREAAAVAAGREVGSIHSLDDEKALLVFIQARVEENQKQAEKLEKEIEGLSALGFKLGDLERRRKMEEDKYRNYQSRLETAMLDEKLDPSKMTNISAIQEPSAPVRSIDGTTMKTIVGIAGSGVFLGLALAFLTEWVIDRRISRPDDIKTRLRLPLMLSIPHIRSKDGIERLIGSTDPLSPPPIPGSKLAIHNGDTNGSEISSKPAHFIAPYAAAIHDRILFNFEINNITHKPKLVALTGLSEGAGTSTIATGIAKAFSEGGNRKVLLVDLNPVRSNASEPVTESLRRALEASRSEKFRSTPQNLYFASAASRRFQGDTTALAPTGLRDILPYLVASDFDYIVFDMPPVGPTSPTMAMAGFMDKVLLVLDAANTTPDNLKWAYSELERGRADVSCIFNKVRSHAPRWVEGNL